MFSSMVVASSTLRTCTAEPVSPVDLRGRLLQSTAQIDSRDRRPSTHYKDLLWHLERGYRLETDSLSGNPLLRKLDREEVLRPASANRSTVEAVGGAGPITQTRALPTIRSLSIQRAAPSAISRSKLTRSPLIRTMPRSISCCPVQSYFS